MSRVLIVLLTTLLFPVLALGQDRPDSEGERFVLHTLDGGMMRIDRNTGAASFCRKREDAWVCEAVADDREALEDEITRLSEDNAQLAREIGRLKERIAMLETRDQSAPETGRKVPDDGTPDADADPPAFDLPGDEEVDKVMKTFESMVHRFLDMMRDLREEYDQDRT